MSLLEQTKIICKKVLLDKKIITLKCFYSWLTLKAIII
jgi:hypothetical protein